MCKCYRGQSLATTTANLTKVVIQSHLQALAKHTQFRTFSVKYFWKCTWKFTCLEMAWTMRQVEVELLVKTTFL